MSDDDQTLLSPGRHTRADADAELLRLCDDAEEGIRDTGWMPIIVAARESVALQADIARLREALWNLAIATARTGVDAGSDLETKLLVAQESLAATEPTR